MKKVLMSFILSALFVTLAACGDGGVEYPVEYFNATVTGSESAGEGRLMTVETTGFYEMVVEVTVNADGLEDYEVISHEESADYGGILIDDTNYLADLVAANGELSSDELDAYSGATATRDALMDAALAALEHYSANYE